MVETGKEAVMDKASDMVETGKKAVMDKAGEHIH